jgi:hypothetical protein
MVDYIVAGGGYRGILAAALLRKKGYKVSLIDAAPHVGGVLFGGKWKQYSLDLGCHLFDNTNPEHTALLIEIFGDIIEPIFVQYAGRTCQHWHENFTVPSLARSPATQADLLLDLMQARSSNQQQSVHNYQQYLIERFGLSAGHLLVRACMKKVQFDPALLDPVACRVVLFDRVNMFDQQLSLFLKKIPEIDQVLATHSVEDPMRFYPEAKKVYPHRNFYPRGGTNNFCIRAKEYLERIGVEIHLGTKIMQFDNNTVQLDSGLSISCKKLFWTLELEKAEKLLLGSSEIESYIHPVPMLVVYFEVLEKDIAEYTYLHDHSDDTAVFRFSSIGKYSKQNIDGYSYICCEVPTRLESEYWKNPDLFIEQFWQEAKLLQIVNSNAEYADYKILKAPVTFKLPKIGFSAMEQQVRNKLSQFDTLILTDSSYFSTQDIAKVIHDELQEL